VADNTPIVRAGRDLTGGETVTLGTNTYEVAVDVPAGTLLYYLNGKLRPWKPTTSDK